MKSMRPPGLLVLAVLGLHLLAGREVDRIQDGWRDGDRSRMPLRMQVEFVREMVMAPPPQPAAAQPVRVAAAPPPAPSPAPAADSAAAPEPAASSPEPPQAAASAPAEPASAPAPATATATTSAGPERSADEPGPEWPLSTRLTYLLTGHYRGPLSGTAQVEWLRQGRDYQVHLDVDLGLISRRMSSQGVLTPDGIEPQRYDEQTKLVMMEPRRATVHFLGAEVQFATGQREPLPRGAQDAASQFVQLTWLFLTGREPLQAGQSVRFPLVLPRRQYAWQYDVVGEETVDTPMGPVTSWHLKPARAAVGGDLLVEVWLAPTLQYLPVRLLIRQDAETHIDLVLQRAPLQAAPESTDPRIPRRLAQ